MNLDAAYELIKTCLWNGMIVSAPLILGALIIGLIVSIFQTITTIQEATLSFLPKLLWAIAGLWFFSPWMLKQLMQLTSLFIQRAGEIVR